MHLWLVLCCTLSVFSFSLSFCQTRPLTCSCVISLDMYMHTPAWESARLWWDLAKKPEMTRERLERCFQKDTVKKLWLLYRFNKYLTPVWLTTIDPSFCGAQSNLECWGAPEPQSLILTQATATVKPAYLHLLKSAGVSVYFYVYVCTCARGDCRPS